MPGAFAVQAEPVSPPQALGVTSNPTFGTVRINGNLQGGTVGVTLGAAGLEFYGLFLSTGAAGVVGTATLVAGTVTVPTSKVTASSVILLSVKTIGGTVGTLSVGTITAGVSFVINSSSGTDTSVVSFIIIN